MSTLLLLWYECYVVPFNMESHYHDEVRECQKKKKKKQKRSCKCSANALMAHWMAFGKVVLLLPINRKELKGSNTHQRKGAKKQRNEMRSLHAQGKFPLSPKLWESSTRGSSGYFSFGFRWLFVSAGLFRHWTYESLIYS